MQSTISPVSGFSVELNLDRDEITEAISVAMATLVQCAVSDGLARHFDACDKVLEMGRSARQAFSNGVDNLQEQAQELTTEVVESTQEVTAECVSRVQAEVTRRLDPVHRAFIKRINAHQKAVRSLRQWRDGFVSHATPLLLPVTVEVTD